MKHVVFTPNDEQKIIRNTMSLSCPDNYVLENPQWMGEFYNPLKAGMQWGMHREFSIGKQWGRGERCKGIWDKLVVSYAKRVCFSSEMLKKILGSVGRRNLLIIFILSRYGQTVPSDIWDRIAIIILLSYIQIIVRQEAKGMDNRVFFFAFCPQRQ